MFCWRPSNIFFLESISEDYKVLLFTLRLDRGGNKSVSYYPKRFQPIL